MIREKCVICDGNKLHDFLTIENMPVYMGVTSELEHNTEKMIFCECEDCSNIQLRKLIDIEVLYSHNHNVDTVGNLWKNHYISFLDFASDGFNDKTILEIGDPSAKIAKIASNYNKWIIVEKNPGIESSDKIVFIESFFDKNFQTNENVDTIVHSHLFEHIYEPKEFLKKCHEILKEDGDMYFSIPDLRYFLEGDFLPNSILQFEHTYFIDELYINKLCSETGFKLVNSFRYANHSVFFHLSKQTDNIEIDFKFDKISNRFLEIYNNLINRIEYLNVKLKESNNVFLYGAHVTSQSYIFNGLNTDNIIGIIDGSDAKQNKYLHSTQLITHSIDILNKYDDISVICSHMGIYEKEISDKLRSINPNVIIL